MEDGPEVDNGRVVGGIALLVLRRPLELLPVVVLVPHDHRHQLLGLEEVHHSPVADLEAGVGIILDNLAKDNKDNAKFYLYLYLR